MTKEYKRVSFHRDYYNDITLEEINSLYDENRQFKTAVVRAAVIEIISCICYLVICIHGIYTIVSAVNEFGLAALLKMFLNNTEGVLTIVSLVVIIPVLLVEIIINSIRAYNNCSDFYFAKGKIISLESEFNESDKKHKNGYYKNILTLAVSENEAIGSIFYFSENEWNETDYIGKSAIGVYYPGIHCMYALIDGEDAENYRKNFKDKFHLDEKKSKGSKKYERRKTS